MSYTPDNIDKKKKKKHKKHKKGSKGERTDKHKKHKKHKKRHRNGESSKHGEGIKDLRELSKSYSDLDKNYSSNSLKVTNGIKNNLHSSNSHYVKSKSKINASRQRKFSASEAIINLTGKDVDGNPETLEVVSSETESDG